jgi:excisionase family DNA binding protein
MRQDYIMLTTRQVADQLKVKPAKVLRLINQGVLPAFKGSLYGYGNRWFIKISDLNAFLEAWIEAIRKKGGK